MRASCSAMQSFERHQARAGHSEVDVPDGVAPHAAASLALSDHELHKVGTLFVQLVLALVLVHLVNLIMTALEASESFKAHPGR